jgi:glycosyltransferase involved in cell wall biosynthesis
MTARQICAALSRPSAGKTWNRREVVVVDNHSTDDTRQVVESFGASPMRLVSVHNNGIIAVSRNLGAAHSSCDYVAFLDSEVL